MKALAHIQPSLLGLIFVVTGLNGFFRVLHQPPLTAPVARELMMGASVTSGPDETLRDTLVLRVFTCSQ